MHRAFASLAALPLLLACAGASPESSATPTTSPGLASAPRGGPICGSSQLILETSTCRVFDEDGQLADADETRGATGGLSCKPHVDDPNRGPGPQDATIRVVACPGCSPAARDPTGAPKLPEGSREDTAARVRELESAVASAPSGRKRRDLLRCLAERNVELEASWSHDGQADRAAGARAAAIRYYRAVADDYPTYRRVDEVLFGLAWEQSQAKDAAGALDAYGQLLAKTPTSHYASRAHFALAESYAAAARAGDRDKRAQAVAEYEQVVNSGEPDTVHGPAWLGLARIHSEAGDFDRTVHELERAVDYAGTFAQLPQGGDSAAMVRQVADLLGPACTRAGRADSCRDWTAKVCRQYARTLVGALCAPH